MKNSLKKLLTKSMLGIVLLGGPTQAQLDIAGKYDNFIPQDIVVNLVEEENMEMDVNEVGFIRKKRNNSS